jgi:protein transport protein SEC24
VAALTGGETFFYSNFHAPRDVLKVRKELAHAITRETGYQCLMKVRCSNGLQVSSYFGNFVQHALGADLEIGSVDAEKAIGVLFSYDGKLDPKLDAHFQAALLYTSADGQRRVRCINVVAAVNEGGMETMKFVDQDAIVAVIAKEGQSSLKQTPNDLHLIVNSPPQLPPRHSTRASRIFVPAFQKRRSIFSVDTARSSQGHTRLGNLFCLRI